MKRDIQIFTDAETLAKAAADFFVELSQQCIREKGHFYVALSGGSTPKRLFRILAKEPYRSTIDWASCYFFFGDERYVPHDHDDSNYKTAKELLFDKVQCPTENVLAVPTNGETAQADAELYERTINQTLEADRPFDLVFLGLGPDGHTASLFPGTTALDEKQKKVVANYVEKLETWRITFSYPLINAASHVMFLVEGEGKADVLKEIIDDDNDNHPAHNIQAKHTLHWYLDGQAARQLKQ